MDWLKNHAFVASWLSPLIALIGLLIRAPRNKQTGEVDWFAIVLYVVLLSLVAGSLNPADSGSTFFARSTFVFVLLLIFYREKR